MKLGGRTAHTHLTSAIATANSNNFSITTHYAVLTGTLNFGHKFIITTEEPNIYFFHTRVST